MTTNHFIIGWKHIYSLVVLISVKKFCLYYLAKARTSPIISCSYTSLPFSLYLLLFVCFVFVYQYWRVKPGLVNARQWVYYSPALPPCYLFALFLVTKSYHEFKPDLNVYSLGRPWTPVSPSACTSRALRLLACSTMSHSDYHILNPLNLSETVKHVLPHKLILCFHFPSWSSVSWAHY